MQDEQLEQLRNKFPDKKLHLLTAPSGEEIVVRRPDRPVWKRFQAQAQDDRRRQEALENLVTGCLVYPENGGWDAMVDERPGLVQSFGNAIVELAGAAQAVEKKAL